MNATDSVKVMTLHLPTSTEGTKSSALVLKTILLLLGCVLGSNTGPTESRRRTAGEENKLGM